MNAELEKVIEDLKKNPKDHDLRRKMAFLLHDGGYEKEALEQLKYLHL